MISMTAGMRRRGVGIGDGGVGGSAGGGMARRGGEVEVRIIQIGLKARA